MKKHTVTYDEYDKFEGKIDKKLFAKKDLVIVVGGDGTILSISEEIAHSNLPVLGINTGHVGFLTQIDKINDIEPTILKIIKKQYVIDARTMLKAEIFRNNKMIYTDVAVNEVLLSKNGLSQICRYNIYVDGKSFNNYSADGMIVATPTGSTAYNLSAGGAIISPNTKALALQPICVHAFNQRGIIISDNSKVEIRIETNPNTIVTDGRVGVVAEIGDVVKVKKASKKLKFFKFNEDIFIKNLKLKMLPI